jgi:tRNA(adenine34) deaminase
MNNNEERDELYMRLALEEAKKAHSAAEVPVGAVLVNNQGFIARGFNQPCLLSDPTAHAEIVVLRQACAEHHNYRLGKDFTLYVTLEPCLMCAGALLQARIGRLVFAATDSRPQSFHRHYNVYQSPAFNHQLIVHSGVLAQEAQKLLAQFFQERR